MSPSQPGGVNLPLWGSFCEFSHEVSELRRCANSHSSALAHHSMNRIAHADGDPVVATKIAGEHRVWVDNEVDLVTHARGDHDRCVRLTCLTHRGDRRVPSFIDEAGDTIRTPLILEQLAGERTRNCILGGNRFGDAHEPNSTPGPVPSRRPSQLSADHELEIPCAPLTVRTVLGSSHESAHTHRFVRPGKSARRWILEEDRALVTGSITHGRSTLSTIGPQTRRC